MKDINIEHDEMMEMREMRFSRGCKPTSIDTWNPRRMRWSWSHAGTRIPAVLTSDKKVMVAYLTGYPEPGKAYDFWVYEPRSVWPMGVDDVRYDRMDSHDQIRWKDKFTRCDKSYCPELEDRYLVIKGVPITLAPISIGLSNIIGIPEPHDSHKIFVMPYLAGVRYTVDEIEKEIYEPRALEPAMLLSTSIPLSRYPIENSGKDHFGYYGWFGDDDYYIYTNMHAHALTAENDRARIVGWVIDFEIDGYFDPYPSIGRDGVVTDFGSSIRLREFAKEYERRYGSTDKIKWSSIVLLSSRFSPLENGTIIVDEAGTPVISKSGPDKIEVIGDRYNFFIRHGEIEYITPYMY